MIAACMRTCVLHARKMIACAMQLFRELLAGEGFQEIHSPKLIAGASEGGSAVFKLDYMGQDACLAQSPQIYKQMALAADMRRVFEITPVFRRVHSRLFNHAFYRCCSGCLRCCHAIMACCCAKCAIRICDAVEEFL